MADADTVTDAGNRFLVSLYKFADKEATSLNKLRYLNLFTLLCYLRSACKTSIHLASLPPTESTAQQHSFRAYFQIQQWFGKEKDPEQRSWKKMKDVLEPVTTLQPPTPQAVLKLISCKCKKTCQKNCGCKKAGLKCSNMCVNCESSCNNMPLTEIEKNEDDPEFPEVLESFSNVHFFHPPVLDMSESSVDVKSNTTLEITCVGKHPLLWKIDSAKIYINDSRLMVYSSVNISQSVNKYKSTLTLEDLDYNDTGFYTCYYEGTDNFDSADNVTSVYVFVNDPLHLFMDKSVMAGYMLVPVQQHRRSIIPCLPTSTKVNVTLWKTDNEDEIGMVNIGSDVIFDPKHGFILYYPTFYFSGGFQCRAYLANVYEEINVTLMFLPDTYHDPQPFIDTSEAQHPVVNATFTLKCTVNVDPGTRLFVEWIYPNKNETGSRINETRPFSQWKITRNYEHQEVITYLIVKEARTSDSGRYVCSVTDHAQKTGRADVNVFVYSSQQRVHVNFTTDINISEPVIYQAGQDVRFVITVHAFPSISDVDLYWERNGDLLVSDGHYHIKIQSSSVVLEISQLHRTDAGTYTLYGKTKDGIDSISILLEVKDKPVVSLKNAEVIYFKDAEYTLECHADGYPVPVVWWRWKPCQEVFDCNAGSTLYGWTDVEFNGKTPNQENVTLEYSEVNTFSLVSYLHLTAKESGHYMCVASNQMGKDDALSPFIVTDAEDGFEISISKRKPVDKDYVELVCKVNAFNFSHVEWKWRPLYQERDLIYAYNLPDIRQQSNSTAYSLMETVIFDPIHLNMSGEYECIASNSKNNLTESKYIIIAVKRIVRPTIYKTNMNGSVIHRFPGSLEEFVCFTDGVPLPSVTWKKDGKIFDTTNMSGVETTENNQKLTIRRVLEKDAGVYECVVENRGGQVRRNTTLDVWKDDAEKAAKETLVIASVIGGVFALLILFCSCSIYAFMRYRKKQEMKKELDFLTHNMLKTGYTDMFNPNLPLGDQVDLLPYKNSWEFPKERLKLGKTLGQGAFGRVVKAEAIGLVDGEASTTVAVKMLKEGADKEQRKALIAELKILIHIGKHLNIVNVLGAVTKNLAKGELYVIVEYCCFGNLRHFLLKHKGTFIDQLDHRTGKLDTSMSTLPGSPFLNMQDNMVIYSNILGIAMDNPTYKMQSLNYADLAHDQATTDSGTGNSVFTNPSGSTMSDRYLRNSSVPPGFGNDSCYEESGKKNHFITTCDLLCFAFQCARGMEYLESRKLIHRDLAARNVLLAKDNVVKICDFGLAKDCYKYSNYIKKSDGLLPIKWMAIESIRDRVFTSKSDVWSFGILLWEIFTLGSSPYPGVEINEEFFKQLKRGYRMEKPDLAPDAIYQLMKNCWLDDPNQRPDFSTLAENVGTLLESSVRKYYVELNEPYQMMNKEIFNNNYYLQMTGQDEEYTNMDHSSELQQSSANTYDNITSVRPIGDGPVPTEPMEVVPMIQLESLSGPLSGTSKEGEENELMTEEYGENGGQRDTEITYLNMGTSPEKYDLDEYDSVFLEEKVPNKVPHINGDCLSIPLLRFNNGVQKHDLGDGCMDE